MIIISDVPQAPPAVRQWSYIFIQSVWLAIFIQTNLENLNQQMENKLMYILEITKLQIIIYVELFMEQIKCL